MAQLTETPVSAQSFKLACDEGRQYGYLKMIRNMPFMINNNW
jgi:hypothetical protein